MARPPSAGPGQAKPPPGPQHKRQRKGAAAAEPPVELPANVIIQFRSETGEASGPQLDVPHTVTLAQLEALLNGLLKNEEQLPYSFALDDLQLAGDLGAHLTQHKVSVERVLGIVYQPQALFRVRPVTRCTASMEGHSDSVLAVAFSPSGRQLASGSGDSTLRFWDLATQTPEAACKGHQSWVLCVAWSPDGAMVASGGKDKALWVWNPREKKPLGCCKGHKEWITSVAWEPAHLALPSRRLVTGSKDTTVKVWDAATRRCQWTMGGHTKSVSCVAWGGDGSILSGGTDCAIHVWSGKEGNLIRTLKGHGHWVNTLALSAAHALRTGAHDHRGACPEALPAAQAAALQRYEEATNGRPERVASGSDDHTLFLWEPSSSSAPIARLTGHAQTVNQVAFSPDGRYLVSASFDKSVKLWDALKGTFLASFFGHVGPVYQVAWSADSRLLLTGSKDSTLKVWSVATRKLALDLPGHADEVYTVDWSPDGSTVASGGKDRVLRLWRR